MWRKKGARRHSKEARVSGRLRPGAAGSEVKGVTKAVPVGTPWATPMSPRSGRQSWECQKEKNRMTRSGLGDYARDTRRGQGQRQKGQEEPTGLLEEGGEQPSNADTKRARGSIAKRGPVGSPTAQLRDPTIAHTPRKMGLTKAYMVF